LAAAKSGGAAGGQFDACNDKQDQESHLSYEKLIVSEHHIGV
jgi:hypothetical protein